MQQVESVLMEDLGHQAGVVGNFARAVGSCDNRLQTPDQFAPADAGLGLPTYRASTPSLLPPRANHAVSAERA